MEFSELAEALKGRTITWVDTSAADCGIILALDDGSTLDIGFSYQYGAIAYRPPMVKVIQNPFAEAKMV